MLVTKRVLQPILCCLLFLSPLFCSQAHGLVSSAEWDAADKLYKKGKYDEALSAYTRIVNQDPENPRAYEKFAIALGAQKRYAEAIDTLRYVLTLDSCRVSTYELLTLYFDLSNQKQKAAAAGFICRLLMSRNLSPASVSSPRGAQTERGSTATAYTMDKNRMLSNFPAYRSSVREMKQEKESLRKFIDACNLQYKDAKAGGRSREYLKVLHEVLQEKIDTRLKRAKARNRSFSKKLSSELRRAIASEARARGVSPDKFQFMNKQNQNGVDVTSSVIKRLQTVRLD